ncbi:kinase-like domain-containing protein, partial [Xylaria palmicola]
MYNADVIAYLFPVDGKGRIGAINAINMKQNAARFIPARRHDNGSCSKLQETQDRSVRKATEQSEDEDTEEDGPCLKFTFSNPPKTRRGLLAGRCPDTNVVLPKFKGVSWYHFALTFDKTNSLVMRDLDSTVGTRVIYDTEDGERGRGINWSACGPGLLKRKAPVIKIVGELQFRIVVPDHNTSSKTYLNNVARFREGAAAAKDILSDIKLLSRVPTELPTPAGEADTPGGVKAPGAILWKRKLGQGKFAVVHYAWDVTTKQEYALKEPYPGCKFNVKAWLKEAEIMKGISHDHIVKLKYASFDNGPQLYFKYVPGKSLEAYLLVTTPFHNKQIAIQLLSGLGYLHTKEVPFVHRDIKPENVLVQQWSPKSVYVKLADFGLSKQAKMLESFCGTLWYAAPELYCLQDSRRYSPLVDLWSLGVLLVRLECGRLPDYENEYQTSGIAWAQVLVRYVKARQRCRGASELLSFVLEDMLVIEPKGRQPAVKCHAKALQLFINETCETLIPSVEDEDGEEESNPATPRARPADSAFIVSLGERDSEALDSWLGLQPSDMSDMPEFQRSAGVSVDSRRAAASLIGEKLWLEPVEEEEEEESRGGGKEGNIAGSLDPSIVKAILGDIANVVSTVDKEADGLADQVSDSLPQYKRPVLEGFGLVAEGLVDRGVESDVTSKRRKVVHCGDLGPEAV